MKILAIRGRNLASLADAFELDFTSRESFERMRDLMSNVGNAMVGRDVGSDAQAPGFCRPDKVHCAPGAHVCNMKSGAGLFSQGYIPGDNRFLSSGGYAFQAQPGCHPAIVHLAAA